MPTSLSVRRAWIEIVSQLAIRVNPLVALREESVDRNKKAPYTVTQPLSRSP